MYTWITLGGRGYSGDMSTCRVLETKSICFSLASCTAPSKGLNFMKILSASKLLEIQGILKFLCVLFCGLVWIFVDFWGRLRVLA